MNLYSLSINGETEMIAAKTNIQALRFYCGLTGFDIRDADFSDDDTIEEFPKEKWADTMVLNTDYDENDPEDKKERSVLEMMEGLTEPELISSSIE